MTATPNTNTAPDISTMTFEAALAELESIVKRLENGQGELDEAIGAYTRGAQLKKHCEAKLAEARARVEKITLAADGTVTTEPISLG